MNDRMDNHAPFAGPATAPRPALSDRVRSLRLPDEPTGGGASKVPWVLCLLFAAAAAYLGYAAYLAPRPAAPAEGEEGSTEAGKYEAAPKGSAAAATPQQVAASGDLALEYEGYIVPTQRIQVGPKVSGMVMELLFQEGDRFKEGDVLAKLETVDYDADVERARATLQMAERKLEELTRSHPREVEQAVAEMAETDAQLKQLKQEWDRNRGLKQRGVAVSERELEQSESQYKAMERRLERMRLAVDLMRTGPRLDRIRMAEAEIRQAKADLAKAQWRLDNCTVRAPVSGTILTKKAEKGNLVNPVAMNISTSLCEMADLSDLEVDLKIQERDVAKVHKGQKCKVRCKAYPERVYEGVVSRLMPIADRGNGAVPVRVKVDVPRNEEGVYLKPDMSATVSFLKASKDK